MRADPTGEVPDVLSSSSRRGVHYELTREIGSGGFGVAYLASVTGLVAGKGKDVCVKLTSDRASWHRECYFGELLRGNERVVQVLDDFPVTVGGSTTDHLYALVTEFAENGSLDDYMDHTAKAWSEDRVRREVRGILSALDQLHRGNAMHRDLTPMNVLVTKSGTLKLGDFGISRHATKGKTVEADVFNYGFVPTAVAVGDVSRWGPVDDVWQVGQLLAVLAQWEVRPVVPKDLRSLACTDELKAVIGRAIGDAPTRYQDAFGLSEALAGNDPPRSTGVRSLRGRDIVFTGKLWTRREDAAALARGAGAVVRDSVSKNTDVLVCGSPSPLYLAKSKGKKRLEAEALNAKGASIKTITEAQFRRLVAK